jgi:DNA-binding transcriptional LysR family regulator
MIDAVNVRRLQLISEVVRQRSISGAAEVLGISQPALSKNIRILEQSLGVQLLERGRFGARPTPFALTLIRHSDAISAELTLAAKEISALKEAKSGSLCIGCGPTEAIRLLPVALERLRKSNPGIVTSVLHGLNDSLLSKVKHGDVDFALSSIPSRRTDPNLKQITLYCDEGVVIARADHPLNKHRGTLSTELLSGYEWVLPPSEELERRVFDELFTKTGVEPPTPIVETTSTTLIKSMVLQNDYLSYVPRELVHWELNVNSLRILPIEDLNWLRTIGITMRARGSISPACHALVNELKEVSHRLNAQEVSRRLRATT